MWGGRRPLMSMILHDPRRHAYPVMVAPESTQEVLVKGPVIDESKLTIADEFKQRSLYAQTRNRAIGIGMFSSNMSHLRGAKPCGSCGGR